jgi:hypothetical protein
MHQIASKISTISGTPEKVREGRMGEKKVGDEGIGKRIGMEEK